MKANVRWEVGRVRREGGRARMEGTITTCRNLRGESRYLGIKEYPPKGCALTLSEEAIFFSCFEFVGIHLQ